MIRQLTVMAACLAAAALAQTKFDNGLVLLFRAGAVRIHTESTHANSMLSPKGVVAIGEGDVSHRRVTGRQGQVVFAYDISLAAVPNDSRAYTIRVKPADPDHYPTISAAREFPAVRLGEAVNLDILFNPSTGEKIFDVIEPVERPAEKRRPAKEEEISLEGFRVTVNGSVIKEFSNNWMIGPAVKITLPRHGTFYLVVKPSPGYAFQAVGRVDGGKLTFPAGNEMVEILSKSNVLKTAETGTLWVYHDTGSKGSPTALVEVGRPEEMLSKW